MGWYPPFHDVNNVSLTNSQRCKKMLKPLLFISAFAIVSLCFRYQRERLFPSSSSSHPPPPTSSTLDHALSPESIQAIHNSTLGFGEIYMINMPGRTDKLDALRLLASVTNISYTVVPGVNGKQIPHVAWPGFYEEKQESRIGSWRAHMNAAASILDNSLLSALIVEDDADWDVSLKTQLTQFALGSQHLLNTPTSSEPLSPYGDGWDMLWLGHCAQDSPSKPLARFFIANDTTIAPAGRRWGLWSPEEALTYDLPRNHTTRVVYRSAGGVCSYAYALSYTGAQKILYHLSYSHFDGPFDVGQAGLCKRGRKGEIDFSCVGVYPGLIHAAFVENDIVYDPTKPRKEREKKKGTPTAPNLVFGVRKNVLRMIEGKELVGRWQGEEEVGDMEMWFDEGKVE
ncbi:MAG: hypothetical protein ASARMPRED_007352 [Alectoria sarmentosa]|nr:MAG: hypothetical protein ASARMPRED_007352 [Alectoria sarmentosa]